MISERTAELQDWLCRFTGSRTYRIEPASSDASFRRYFRVFCDGRTYIVMDAPPEREDCRPYATVATAFRAAGLNVPEILDADFDRGFLLLTDLGSRLYLDELDRSTAGRLYGDAGSALLRLQVHGALQSAPLPPYDHSRLRGELDLFRDWYLGTHLGIVLDAAQRHDLEAVYEQLIRSALDQPAVWVHRDYHSRNLMVVPENNPGILDFQDAVTGPVTYDLVSLLRDCYIAWPPHDVQAWVTGFYRAAQTAGLLPDVDHGQFLHWFDWMGVQRHLKAVGIFARLHHRDGKPGYLGDIPRTLAYVLDVSGRYRELAPLQGLLEDLVVSRPDAGVPRYSGDVK